MSIPNLRAIPPLDALLGLMACLSILVLMMPREWLSHSFELNPLDFQAQLSGDSYSGGNSRVKWEDHDLQRWSCELDEQFRSPYCSYLLFLADADGKGFDLEAVTSMTIWLSYQGNAEHIRLYLRNRHPNYFHASDTTSTKYNTVEIPVEKMGEGLTINMADFRVAEWWLVQKRIALSDSHPEFSDIVVLEVQTGSLVREGRHEIQLHKVVFNGTLITRESLYKWMVIGWSVCILLMLLYRLLHLRWTLNKTIRHQQELESINKLLNLQNKKFEDLAKTDQLTGLLNRVGIREPLYKGLKAWEESRTPFSFVLIDLDHFKQVNDNYGHKAGDDTLIAAAKLLDRNVRRTDYLARWGGEEFILVCPNTTLEQASTLAETLRRKIEEAELHPASNVTASFGVASMSEPSLDQLFKLADEALYAAKSQGRNCVVSKY